MDQFDPWQIVPRQVFYTLFQMRWMLLVMLVVSGIIRCADVSSRGPEKPSHPHSLIRPFAAQNVWMLRNLQT